MIRLIYFVPIWFLFLLIRIVFIVLGFIFVPIAVLFKAYKKDQSLWGKEVTLFTWKIMSPWQNLEDGIDAGLELPNAPQWVRIIVWSCYRNPTNGFRFTPVLGTKYDQNKLKYIFIPKVKREYQALYDAEESKTFHTFFYLCWQGVLYSNMKVQVKIFNYTISLWWGNSKLYPSAVFKIPNYQLYGVGPVGPSFKFKNVSKS